MEPGKFYEPFEGFLWKRGEHGLRTWKKRFFSLKQNILYYYDDPKNAISTTSTNSVAVPQTKSNTQLPNQPLTHNPKGRIILSEALAIQPSEGGASFSDLLSGVMPAKKSSDSDEIPSYFEIKCPGRIYYLCANSQSEMQRWLNALQYSRELYGEISPRHSVNSNVENNSQPSSSTSEPSAPPLTESVISLLDNNNNNTYGDAYLYHSPYSTSFENTNTPSSSSANPSVYYENPPLTSLPPATPLPSITPTTNHIEVSEKFLKEINFTEGEVTKKYVEDMKVLFSLFNDPRIQGEASLYRRKLAVYLLLSSLHSDNFSFFSNLYSRERIFGKLTQCIEISRNSILQIHKWKLEAPTTITQIDTWMKRRHNSNASKFIRGDKESMYCINIVALSFIKKNLQDCIDADLNEILSQTQDLLLSTELDYLPRRFFGAKLLASIDISKLPKEFSSNATNMTLLRDFVEINFVYQKLKLENDEANTTKRDPYLHNKFEQILSELNSVSNSLLRAMQAIHSDLRTGEMKIFGSWRNELNLLYSNSPELKTDHYTLLLKNERILKRLGVKAHRFQKLQEALLMCAIAVAERLPHTEESKNGNEDLLLQIVQSIN